ncbi:Uncharacterised protein [uncultured archaeon]|nr:Uncharacterised protein [uncultured archaeon]
MSKNDTFVLRGKLERKPLTGFSYFATRNEFRKILQNAKLGDDAIFSRVGNVKIEDEKFDIPLKVDRAVLSGLKDDWAREAKICEIGMALEAHFGIGMGMDSDGKQEEKSAVTERLKEMAARGIIPVRFFTEFEEKDFEES